MNSILNNIINIKCVFYEIKILFIGFPKSDYLYIYIDILSNKSDYYQKLRNHNVETKLINKSLLFSFDNLLLVCNLGLFFTIFVVFLFCIVT